MKTETQKPAPLKTRNDLLQVADQYATLHLEIDQLDATKSLEENDLKTRWKTKLTAPKKKRASLKDRLKRFVLKNATLLDLFGGKETGTLVTELAEIKLRKDPESIEPCNKEITTEELVAKAKEHGYRHIVIPSETISLQALKKYDDETLKLLGFKKTGGLTFTITPLAKKS